MRKIEVPNVVIVGGISSTCVTLLEDVKKAKEEMEAATKRYYAALNAYREQHDLLHKALPPAHEV